eukprot:EG_transcript_27464
MDRTLTQPPKVAEFLATIKQGWENRKNPAVDPLHDNLLLEAAKKKASGMAGTEQSAFAHLLEIECSAMLVPFHTTGVVCIYAMSPNMGHGCVIRANLVSFPGVNPRHFAI